jgi:hypothetical protein
VIVRSSWPYDGEGGRRDPRQAFTPVAIVCAVVWAAAILAVLVVLALKLLA